jgi:hypothetical protein
VILDPLIRVLVSVLIMFVTSLIYGWACVKTYDLFQDAIRKKSRIKLWWAFSTAMFGLSAFLLGFWNIAVKI